MKKILKIIAVNMQKIYVTLREFIDGKKSNHCFVQVSDGGIGLSAELV